MSEQLKRQAEEIRDEVQKGANTAERVGGVLVGIIEESEMSADWNEMDENSPAYIKNKPALGTGGNQVTSLSTLPTNRRSITAVLARATGIGLANELQAGEELYIRCVTTAEFDQPIPNSGEWCSMSGGVIHVMESDVFEISIWCYESNKYSISIKMRGEIC